MAHIKTFSVPDNEIAILNEFTELCKLNGMSRSEEILTFMAKAVQAHKEGKTLHYEKSKLWSKQNG